MSTSTSRILGHAGDIARFTGDVTPSGGPFPSMSARAKLIARVLGVALLFAWLAATESRLLVVLAFALPFWIASEIEVWRQRAKPATPFLGGELVSLRAFDRRPTRDRSKAA